MPRHLVLGNWKCNGKRDQVTAFAEGFQHPPAIEGFRYGIALPFHLLEAASGFGEMAFGGQDVSPYLNGAFTGEISAEMLNDLGCRFCLVGHSERRQFFGESVKSTAMKLQRLLQIGITPVFCIGETLEEREQGLLRMILTDQLTPMHALEKDARFAVAYEPVWAIGTGVAAGPNDVKQAHFLIKRLLADAGFAETPVLYGGSVKPNNARSLAQISQLDGFLVGGASLSAPDFSGIVNEYIAGKQLA